MEGRVRLLEGHICVASGAVNRLFATLLRFAARPSRGAVCSRSLSQDNALEQSFKSHKSLIQSIFADEFQTLWMYVRIASASASMRSIRCFTRSPIETMPRI